MKLMYSESNITHSLLLPFGHMTLNHSSTFLASNTHLGIQYNSQFAVDSDGSLSYVNTPP